MVTADKIFQLVTFYTQYLGKVTDLFLGWVLSCLFSTLSRWNLKLNKMYFHTESIQAEESKLVTTKRYKICRVTATGQIQNG